MNIFKKTASWIKETARRIWASITKALNKILTWIVYVFSGDVIIRNGIDRQIGFILYCFLLICCYMIYGLYVESEMAQAVKNERVIDDLRIEYYQTQLKITGLNQRGEVEKALKRVGNHTLHAPVKPPQRIELGSNEEKH